MPSALGYIPEGVWSSSTQYEHLHMVTYNGELYVCLQLHTNKNPATEAAYWLKVVAKGADGLANPMTAVGDIIIGGTSGAATRLEKSTDGKVLKLVSGAPAWADESGGSTYTAGTGIDITDNVISATGGGGGGISDAPSDSKTYARKNAAWVEIPCSDATSYGNPGGTGARNSYVIISSSSGLFGDAPLGALLDGVQTQTGNSYVSTGSQAVSGHWIKLQFESAVIVNEITIYMYTAAPVLGVWKAQGSNDNSNWTDIGGNATVTGNVDVDGATKKYVMTTLSANTIRYLYCRILGESGTTDDTYIDEIEAKVSR